MSDPNQSEMKTSSELTLLIVDDEPELLETTGQLCEELNCRILMAPNGRQALDQVKQNQVHAILSDINMPVMNGLQFLKELRELGYETPFIVLSGYGDRNNITQALRLGANDFLDKPFDDEHLLRTLQWALHLGDALERARLEMTQILNHTSFSEEEKDRLKQAHKAVFVIREQRLKAQKKAA